MSQKRGFNSKQNFQDCREKPQRRQPRQINQGERKLTHDHHYPLQPQQKHQIKSQQHEGQGWREDQPQKEVASASSSAKEVTVLKTLTTDEHISKDEIELTFLFILLLTSVWYSLTYFWFRPSSNDVTFTHTLTHKLTHTQIELTFLKPALGTDKVMECHLLETSELSPNLFYVIPLDEASQNVILEFAQMSEQLENHFQIGQIPTPGGDSYKLKTLVAVNMKDVRKNIYCPYLRLQP